MLLSRAISKRDDNRRDEAIALGRRLKKVFEHGHWRTYLEMAVTFEISSLTQLHRYFRGTSEPSAKILRAANAFGVRIDWLLTGCGTMYLKNSVGRARARAARQHTARLKEQGLHLATGAITGRRKARTRQNDEAPPPKRRPSGSTRLKRPPGNASRIAKDGIPPTPIASASRRRHDRGTAS